MEPVVAGLPDWVAIKEFEADTPLIDKVSRVFNNSLAFVSLVGVGAYLAGAPPLVLYASYIAMGLAARKVIATFIGRIAYPASVQLPPHLNEKNHLKAEGKRQIDLIEKQGFSAEIIPLYKSGVKYEAIRITHPRTIQNGKWTIHALGNGIAMEHLVSMCATTSLKMGSNTLLINGPSVGGSDGRPTRYQMGAGFETGLTYLEKIVKATHIIMDGLSLGGGMMGEAILQHDFTEGMKNKIKYLSISKVTFSRLSTIAAALVGRIVLPIFYIVGAELDGVAAAKKLSQLGISQIIIQHTSKDATGTDDVIPDNVSLAYEVHQDPTMTNKIFLESEHISHSEFPVDIENQLNGHIKQFLNTA